MSRFNQRHAPLSRAQNAVLNPVSLSSERAKVLAVFEAGYHDNSRGIPTVSFMVEPEENPGHPMQITGLASIADLMKGLEKGDTVSFNGTIQGSLSRGRTPYVLVSEIVRLSQD